MKRAENARQEIYKPAVALVVPDLTQHSGVPALALFLFRVIEASGRYRAELISLSSSMRDRNSTRLLSPASWFQRAKRSAGVWQGLKYQHVGANFTELEFQRYRPRRELTRLLAGFDIVQVVAGCPPWALVAKDYEGRVALQVATLTRVERATMLLKTHWSKRGWLWLMTRLNTALERPALRRADVVFVENSWMYELLKKQLGAEKVVFAPPGIDTDYFVPAEYLADSYWLAVGRWNDPRKNVRLLFEAYERVRRELKDAPKLLLVGESAPTTEDMAYAARLGIEQHLLIKQGVSLENLLELYQNASLFLLSSNEEGFGFVILEAMACGLPVISTSCGGPETLVRDGLTGYLTPVGDAEAMSRKILALHAEPDLRRKMGSAARARAVDKFSLAATGRVFLNHYDRLLAGDVPNDDVS